MEQWSIYIIRCNNGTLYTGISTNVERRFNEHSQGSKKSAKFLRGKGPLELVYTNVIGNRSEATKLEATVKKLTKLDKELLITKKLLL